MMTPVERAAAFERALRPALAILADPAADEAEWARCREALRKVTEIIDAIRGADDDAEAATTPSAPAPRAPGHRAPFAVGQGNPGTRRRRPVDDADPAKPGDPPWRSRTARRTSTPAAAAALRDGRRRRGWSQTRAAAETGVSRPHISLLERGLRRPSESAAESLIRGYRLTPSEAGAVRAISVAWAGRDSPFRTGTAPDDDDGWQT
jgi:hypothetical protein